jgi:hypothetical protein
VFTLFEKREDIVPPLGKGGVGGISVVLERNIIWKEKERTDGKLG